MDALITAINKAKPYIVIEGVIGAGKTTLANRLHQIIGGKLVLEKFEENPFLKKFYSDKSRYAFQTQLYFLLERYKQQKAVFMDKADTVLISDYCFCKDKIFAEINLVGDELDLYRGVETQLEKMIPSPDLVIFLTASLDTLLAHIKKRNRSYERNMDPDYLNRLKSAYEKQFLIHNNSRIINVDMDQVDVENSPEVLHEILKKIGSYL